MIASYLLVVSVARLRYLYKTAKKLGFTKADLKGIQLITRFGELIDYEFVFRAICDKMHEDLRAFVEDGIDKATAITERLNLNLKF